VARTQEEAERMERGEDVKVRQSDDDIAEEAPAAAEEDAEQPSEADESEENA
jgi:hypothetical protein